MKDLPQLEDRIGGVVEALARLRGERDALRHEVTRLRDRVRELEHASDAGEAVTARLRRERGELLTSLRETLRDLEAEAAAVPRGR